MKVSKHSKKHCQTVKLGDSVLFFSVLNLSFTQVKDVSPLSSLTSLKALHLHGTSVKNLTPLSSLVGLSWLKMEKTPVTDLTPLCIKDIKRLKMKLCTLSILLIFCFCSNNNVQRDEYPFKSFPSEKALRSVMIL